MRIMLLWRSKISAPSITTRWIFKHCDLHRERWWNPRDCNHSTTLTSLYSPEDSEFSPSFPWFFLIRFPHKISPDFACFFLFKSWSSPNIETSLISVVQHWPFDQPSRKNSTINWCCHWDLSNKAQISLLPNSSSKSLSNEPWPRRSSRPPAKGPPQRTNLLPLLGHCSPERPQAHPHCGRYYLRTFAGGSRRHTPIMNLWSPILPNVH